jgi:hypothetical protein
MRARCRGEEDGLDGPTLCKEILSVLDTRNFGFCKSTTLKPSKEGGYVQLSYGGANKFAVLQEVLLWAGGVTRVDSGDQCSHLCGNPLCTLPEHVCLEDAKKNNSRKGCVVWWDCPHCDKKIKICQHEPSCIKFVPGFISWKEFLENGLHL